MQDASIGDLIIRTGDGTDFHVYKYTMAHASAVFSGMFLLPQPPSGLESDKKYVVDVQESTALWTQILAFCHFQLPFSKQLPTLQVIVDLLEAGRKYEMVALTEHLRLTLLLPDFLERHTLSIYAIGCAYRLDGVARAAARASLSLPKRIPFVKEFDLITTRELHKLLDYRARCADAIGATMTWTVSPPEWFLNPDIRVELEQAIKAPDSLGSDIRLEVADFYTHPAWRTGMERLKNYFELNPLPISAFSLELLEPLLSTFEDVKDAMAFMPRVRRFAILLDNEIQRAIQQVCSYFGASCFNFGLCLLVAISRLRSAMARRNDHYLCAGKGLWRPLFSIL